MTSPLIGFNSFYYSGPPNEDVRKAVNSLLEEQSQWEFKVDLKWETKKYWNSETQKYEASEIQK